MPPRIPSKSFADLVVQSGPRRQRAVGLAQASNHPTLLLSQSSITPSSSSSLLNSTASKSRAFTCSSCLSSSPTGAQRQASNTREGERDEAKSHARQLQESTPPASHGGAGWSPQPQRRLPRWAETPAAMKAPFSVHKNDPANRFAVNEDPARLDRAYVAVFGEGGDTLLPEEVKWLAVTHKSFDQGRRGFNDRIAFLGKRIVDLQTSLAILAQPTATDRMRGGSEGTTTTMTMTTATKDGTTKEVEFDDLGREIYKHPAMDIVPKLRLDVRLDHALPRRIAGLARDFGLEDVVRWKPRRATDLVLSGQSPVLTQALYAMVGALALCKGGDVAVQAVRARLLPRLGLNV